MNREPAVNSPAVTMKDAIAVTLGLGGVALIWSLSYWIFIRACSTPVAPIDTGSLVTVLFGASTIALFILSFLLAVIAAAGWQTYKDFREGVVRDVEGLRVDLALLGNELRGRAAIVLGYALGEMGMKEGSFGAGDRDRLEQAVMQCKEGHKHLQKVGIGSPVEILGLNNLLFYTCVLHQGELDKGDTSYILAEAHRLKDAGEKHDVPMLKLTACRVFLEYSAFPQDRAQSYAELRVLAKRTKGISDREKKEAQFYLNEYPES